MVRPRRVSPPHLFSRHFATPAESLVSALEPRFPAPAPAVPERRTPLRYGSLELNSRFLLSPLAGFTNLEFRVIVRRLGGVGLATTDLVNARALLTQNPGSMNLIATCPEDSPFAVQLFGSDPDEMCAAARFLEARGVHSVDINMGCPVQRIVAAGAGSAMLCRTDQTVELVRRIVAAVRIPVTVKMRLGWDDQNITAPQFARAFEEVGVAAIAIHGRTRAQGFSGAVNLHGIRQVVEAVRSIPIIGNGDVRTVPDAARMLDETGCTGVSIGRAALANPWIFRQLHEWETTGTYSPAGTFLDRLQLLRRQFEWVCERFGTEHGIVRFRKMAHWYLKGMLVRNYLRGQFQAAKTLAEVEATLREIEHEGPVRGTKTGLLPELHVPVPAGPVEKW